MSLFSLVVLLPWYLWSLINVGTIRQSSSVTIPYKNHMVLLIMNNVGYLSWPFMFEEIKNVIISSGITLMTFGIGNLIPFLEIRYSYYTGTIGTAIFFFLIAILLIFLIAKNKLPVKKYYEKLSDFNFLIIYSVIIILYYALYHWYLAIRYFYPATLIGIILIGLIFYYVLIEILPKIKLNKNIFLILVGLIVIIGFVNTAGAFWEHGRNPWQIEIKETALWFKENLPEGTRIGTFNSGIHSYFSDRIIVNLDGVVNWDVYEATKNRELIKYLRDNNVQYIADYEDFFEEYKPFFGGNIEEEFTLVHRIDGKYFHNGKDVLIYKI